MELFSLLATLCLLFVVLCVERGGCPSIYNGLEAVLEAIFGASIGLHHLCMLPCHRWMKERQRGTGGGGPSPRVGHPLTWPSRHRLCMVGCGLALERSHMGVLPKFAR